MKHNFKSVAIAYNAGVPKLIALFSAVIALSLFLYGFFLLEAVAHTANRAQAQNQIQAVTSKLSVLEQEYLAKTAGMTLERAQQLGFVAPPKTAVIYADRAADALSVRMQY